MNGEKENIEEMKEVLNTPQTYNKMSKTRFARRKASSYYQLLKLQANTDSI